MMIKKLSGNEKGSVMIMVVISLLVLIGFTGLAIHTGSGYLVKSRLQIAADAAALAGAAELPDKTAATTKATEYAQKNGIQVPPDQMEIDPDYGSDQIEVICSRIVSTPLLSMVGFGQSTVRARAVAEKGGAPAAFDYTLFSEQTIVNVTGNKSTIIGDVYAHDTIDNKHTTILGDAVVSGNNPGDIDVKFATQKKYDTVEVLPDLSEVVEAQTDHCLDMDDFRAQTDLEDKNDTLGYLDHEIVYYEGDLNIDDILFGGVGIIFASGTISMDGGGQVSVDDSIIFYTASDDSKNAIHFTGSGQDCMGFLYAPNGGIKFSGTGADVNGRCIGAKDIWFAGGGVTVDGAINEDVFDMLKKNLRLVE